MLELKPHQLSALDRLRTGCILNGGVGSGKSLTALSYYYLQQGGSREFLIGSEYKKMKNPKDLYIITTAQKRDKLEWDKELCYFLLSKNPGDDFYKNKVIIDSWNNIVKYKTVNNAFFIFDEDHVTGYGTWVKAFLEIAKKNEWIVLSATPGDKWEDYMAVFIANGFYKNKTQFVDEHIIYDYRVKFPKVARYLNVGRLIRLRNRILIDMDFERRTVPHHEDIFVRYDIDKYREIGKLRWNPYENEPIKSASELCYTWRKVVNSDISRQVALLEIFEDHPKIIVFYNFDYELDILKNTFKNIDGVEIAEWNGHAHQEIPNGSSWVYLVQYNAGAEGWNCIKTDTIVFYSQTYSYKTLIQACGRIDRMNTPFIDLYYYHIKARSGIDLGISKALKQKKNFNEGKFAKIA